MPLFLNEDSDESPVLDINEPLFIETWDKDLIGEDYMGRCMIFLDKCPFSNVEDPGEKPEFHKLSLNLGTECGEILVAVDVYYTDFGFVLPSHIDINERN